MQISKAGLFTAIGLLARLGYAENSLIVKGDFRFRTESIKEEQFAPLSEADRSRQRIRLRVGGAAKVNDSTDINIRLATGSTLSTDTGSTNQDLTDYYSKKSILLDLAYFSWKTSEDVTIIGGKSMIPFYMVGGHDMIFDSDLTPEGLALKYKMAFESHELFINAATSWLNERYSATGATDNTDVGLVGAQMGYNYKADSFNVGINLANYNFSNIKGSTAPTAKGNTLTSGAYTVGYKLTTVGLELGSKLADVPFNIYAESVSNSEGENYKLGKIVGVKFGKLKDIGSWTLSVDNRELEKDSTVGLLADADSAGGGTDIRSTRISGVYQAAENFNLGLTALSGKKSISSTTFSPNYQRMMLDFNYNY